MESTRNRLIQLLAKHHGSYISGQTLSEELKISRSAIWKHMNELKKDGYVIEGISNKGYRIKGYPNKISENTVRWGLKTEWLGHSIIHKESVSTTQEIAHQAARNHAAHGTVVIADEQTAGKGRMERQWHSAKDQGIWLSIILRPTILPYLAPQFTLLTATVLADVLENKNVSNVQIKWPNDILLHQRKVAGILTEMQAEQDTIQYMVIGIGINVNHTEEQFPSDIKSRATSLRIETNQTWDKTSLIQAILEELEKAYTEFIKSGFSKVKSKWESYAYRIGEAIHIKTMKNEWVGIFHGIGEDGALLVTDKENKETKLYSAEIDWFED